jgi:hypothetical protein
MRLFFRPNASADVGSILASTGLATVWVAGSFWGRSYWGDAFPGASWVIPAALAGSLLLRSKSRHTLLRGWASLTSHARPTVENAGIIEESEAERELRTDEDGDEELSVKARYIVRVRLDDGQRVTCELPVKPWSRVRVGQRVRLQSRGRWLLEIESEGAERP